MPKAVRGEIDREGERECVRVRVPNKTNGVDIH